MSAAQGRVSDPSTWPPAELQAALDRGDIVAAEPILCRACGHPIPHDYTEVHPGPHHASCCPDCTEAVACDPV